MVNSQIFLVVRSIYIYNNNFRSNWHMVITGTREKKRRFSVILPDFDFATFRSIILSAHNLGIHLCQRMWKLLATAKTRNLKRCAEIWTNCLSKTITSGCRYCINTNIYFCNVSKTCFVAAMTLYVIAAYKVIAATEEKKLKIR